MPINHKQVNYTIGILVFLLACLPAAGQVEYPSLSPRGTISQVVGNTKVEIEYERPSARNRRVFGELVPWDKVWRTGAGNCTKIGFDKDVVLGGHPVKAGRYSLFTIPNPREWVVILNSDTTLYGSGRYNPEKDVARFVVLPKKSPRFYETLTIDIDLVPNNARIYISWEHTAIDFELITTTLADLMQYIDEFLLTRKEADANRYSNAAEQLYFSNTRLNEAIRLTDIAIEKNSDDGFARRVKMDIYEKLHRYDKALQVVENAIENEKDPGEIAYWREHQKRLEKKIQDAP